MKPEKQEEFEEEPEQEEYFGFDLGIKPITVEDIFGDWNSQFDLGF